MRRISVRPAAAADVRLHHGDLADLDPLADLEAGGGELGAADADRAALREPRVAREIVVLQRRFGEVDVAVLDAIEHPFGVVPVAASGSRSRASS